jgi:hypothetical protein
MGGRREMWSWAVTAGAAAPSEIAQSNGSARSGMPDEVKPRRWDAGSEAHAGTRWDLTGEERL